MSYANGRVPLTALVHLGGDHYLPAGTTARWQWLQRTAYEKYGVWLTITAGWNAYRPYDVQVDYKRRYGNMAAEPGKSSHGGIYGGRNVFAVDVFNWSALGFARFAALCRLAGFATNFVTPEELWHIGDQNDPWAAPGFASSTPAINPATTRQVIYEEDDMILITAPGRGSAVIGPGAFTPLAPSEIAAAKRMVMGREMGGTDEEFDTWRRLALGTDHAKLAEAVWAHQLPAQTADGAIDPRGGKYPAGQMQASTDARVVGVLGFVKKLLGKS